MAMSSSDVDTRESETASAWFTETCTGSHLLDIIGYSFDKGIGVGKCITSDTFTVGGYNWVFRYYPDGKFANTKDYVAVDLNLRSHASKARVKITSTLLSQTGETPIMCCTHDAVTISTNDSWGFPCFIKREQLETPQYLKNDHFAIRCTLTVIKQSGLEMTTCKTYPSTVKLQPSNLHQQLTSLLECGDGTDVSFNVRGVTFDAHKCVLAARSPVFRAEFFGPFKGKKNESIDIKDMEPSIFKSMLHFIYSDSVPQLEEVEGNKDESLLLAQHLLVAADRYDLERLKQLCEIKLYEFIDANNVATALILAERHNCFNLKAACLEFIMRPEVIAVAALTEGFEHIIKSWPEILVELRLKNHGL